MKRPKGAPRDLYNGNGNHADDDVLLVPAGVMDRDDLDAVEQAKKYTHDLVVTELGDRRKSGVTWHIWDANDDAVDKVRKLFLDGPGKPVGHDYRQKAQGLIDFLEANPRGLLVVASAKYDATVEATKDRSWGKRNLYVCEECEQAIATEDIDEGVTPSFLACRAHGDEPNELVCGGTMQSQWYPAEPWGEIFTATLACVGPEARVDRLHIEIAVPPITWEWYRPEGAEYRALDGAMKDHVDRGGLALRRREGAA